MKTNLIITSWKDFEKLARIIMSEIYNVELKEKKIMGFPKKFDLVSEDFSVIGDAKYLTLVKGKKLPPAKFMEISGHVWLLEKVNAKSKFLVFGNQREVPEWWLEKYGQYVNNVQFFFLENTGQLSKLNET